LVFLLPAESFFSSLFCFVWPGPKAKPKTKANISFGKLLTDPWPALNNYSGDFFLRVSLAFHSCTYRKSIQRNSLNVRKTFHIYLWSANARQTTKWQNKIHLKMEHFVAVFFCCSCYISPIGNWKFASLVIRTLFDLIRIRFNSIRFVFDLI